MVDGLLQFLGIGRLGPENHGRQLHLDVVFYAAVAGPKDEDPKMEKESVGDRIANGATRSEGAGSKLR